jgi:hypothetical protein
MSRRGVGLRGDEIYGLAHDVVEDRTVFIHHRIGAPKVDRRPCSRARVTGALRADRVSEKGGGAEA